jgi:hypothetical protein
MTSWPGHEAKYSTPPPQVRRCGRSSGKRRIPRRLTCAKAMCSATKGRCAPRHGRRNDAEDLLYGVARNCHLRWCCPGKRDEACAPSQDEARAQPQSDCDEACPEECDPAEECDPDVRRRRAGNRHMCLRYGRKWPPIYVPGGPMVPHPRTRLYPVSAQLPPNDRNVPIVFCANLRGPVALSSRSFLGGWVWNQSFPAWRPRPQPAPSPRGLGQRRSLHLARSTQPLMHEVPN